MERFKGHTAVVTGAASGDRCGHRVALARNGTRVVDRDASVTAAVVAYDGVPLVGDVSDPDLAPELLDVMAQLGLGLDRFVGAAGIQVRTLGIDIDEPDWQRLFDVNLSGFYRPLRALVPALGRGSNGSPRNVVRVMSMSADRPTPGIVPYGSAKAALSHLIRGLAVELGPPGNPPERHSPR
jgi:NAD(P)-dependent dehydrogenase (short-subunit alcohol dehydrogenase family)